jgi:hypothetical protein
LSSVCSLTATNSDCLYEAVKVTSETLPGAPPVGRVPDGTVA